MSDDSQQNSKSGAAHSPSIKRKLRKTILFMAIGGTLLLGLIFGFLQSGFGKSLLAGFINSHLKPSGLQISGIQGFLPFEFRLAGLQCSDSEGTWLEAENLEVHCTWFSGELDLDIKRFSCSKVTILRMPENTDGSKETKPLWPLPLEEYALRARSMQIQAIHVSPDIVDSLGIEELDPEGDGTVLSVDGRMEASCMRLSGEAKIVVEEWADALFEFEAKGNLPELTGKIVFAETGRDLIADLCGKELGKVKVELSGKRPPNSDALSMDCQLSTEELGPINSSFRIRVESPHSELTSIKLSWQESVIEAKGTFSLLGGPLEGNITGRFPDLSTLEKLIPGFRLTGSAGFSAKIGGTGARPEIDADLTLTTPVTRYATAKKLTLNLKTEPQDDQSIRVNMQAKGEVITTPAVFHTFETVSIGGKATLEGNLIRGVELRLQTTGIALKANMPDLNFSEGQLKGRLQLNVDRPLRLSRTLPLPDLADLSLTAEVEAHLSEKKASARIQASAEFTEGDKSAAANVLLALLGEKPDLIGELVWDGEQIHFNECRLSGSEITVKVGGTVSPSSKRLDLKTAVNPMRLEAIGGMLGLPLGGDLHLNADVTGDFSNPKADVAAKINGLSIHDVHSPELAFSLSVSAEKNETGTQLLKLKGKTKADRLSYASTNLVNLNSNLELGLAPSKGSWTGQLSVNTGFPFLRTKAAVGNLSATFDGNTDGRFRLKSKLELSNGSKEIESGKIAVESFGNYKKGDIDAQWKANCPGSYLIPEDVRFLFGEELESQGSLLLRNNMFQEAESLGSFGKIRYSLAAASDEGGIRSSLTFDILDGKQILFQDVSFAGDTRLRLSASGNPIKPEVSLNLRSSNIKFPACGIRDLEADLTVPALPYSKLQTDLAVKGKARASVVADAIKEGFPSLPTDLTFDANLKDQELNVRSLTFRSGPASMTSAGRAFLKKKTADFGAQFKLKNTKGLQELVPHIPDGTCSIAVRGSTDLNKGIAHVHLEGDAAKLSSSSAIVNEAMGSKPHFQTDLVLDAEHILLKNFSMQGRHALLDGDADYSRSSEEYGATCKGTIRKLDAFSTALEIPLAGSVKLDGSIQGDPKKTEYQVLLTSEILEICGQNLNELNIRSSFTQSPEIRGETRASFELGESSLKSRARFEFIDNGLRISELNIEGFDSSLNGILVLNWIGSVPVIDGTVRLKCRDLSLPASYFDTTLSGSADAELSLQAFDGIQSAKLQMAGTKLKLKLPDSPSIKVDNLETTLSSSHLLSQELTELNLNVSGFNRADLALETAKISVRNEDDSFSVEASAVGDWQKQKANFALAGAFSEKNIGLSELKGMFGDIPIELQNPASLTTDRSFLDFEGTDFRSSNWDLKVGLGRLNGQIDRKGENISSTLSVAAIEIQPFLSAELNHIEGLVSGSIALSGTTNSPNLKAELEVQDLTSSEIGPKELSIRPTLSFELREQRLRGKLGLLDQSENLISASRVECKFSVPVHVRLAPMVFGLDPDSQISIGVSSNVDIARLDQLLLVDEHSLNGKAKLDFSLEGSFNQPRWSADASVTDGTYTNAITGTSFQSIVMEMTGTDSKMVIKASATDGGLGSLRMEGWLIPSLARSFAHAFRLELKNAHLVRVDSLALAANGDLSFAGDMRRHRLNGELTISPGELVIPGSSGEEIAEIAITEVNGPADQMPDKPSVKSSLPEVDLDINVNVPGRVYVRGRGLASEWKGGLSVSGTTDSPTVTGKLSILRGHFVFAGKRFGIRSGSLVFAGNKPPSPNLDIEAETETGGITAGLRLFGPVTSPQLELKSIPELPRDEILARILFGKQLASISALQALRLASAIKTLAGGGSAFDLSAKLRRFTGVDQIELRKGENESMGQGRVAVGKYVVEGVYVEVEKGLRTNQDKVTVEVDITPNISAETELDAKGGRGVGLNWKWDY